MFSGYAGIFFGWVSVFINNEVPEFGRSRLRNRLENIGIIIPVLKNSHFADIAFINPVSCFIECIHGELCAELMGMKVFLEAIDRFSAFGRSRCLGFAAA